VKEELSVLLTTEGTYPHSPGGVSTWCDTLVRSTPDIRYVLLPIMMNPHIEQRYELPPNVRRIINTPLWGIEEPAEFLTEISFARLHARKSETFERIIETEFVPLFTRFLEIVLRGESSADFGRVLLQMEEYFGRRDYNQTFKSRPVWQTFRRLVEEQCRVEASSHTFPEAERRVPTLFDITESLRWLYRFLIVLNVRLPRTSVTHSTAAAFCGIPCIIAKIRHGTPMLLTEHGVYLREQNLFLSRYRRLFFSKRFLLRLITAVSRANYHFADIIAPVCHYNTRWEVAHGTPREKIRIIYNGVDPDVFTTAPRSAGEAHVIATARIDPLKDIETFLRMAALVHETHPAVRFTIFGTVVDQPYFERCLALRRELALDSVVEMGKHTDDVIAAYHSADVVVLTSLSEAFPYSVLEAMSCGKAIVATDVGGVREALSGCGALVAPRDAVAAAEEVRRFLDDAAMRERTGSKARAKVVENFRIDHTTSSYLRLYRSLAERVA
jgi:glycosyltransferase involved in cell wall biosynthesis